MIRNLKLSILIVQERNKKINIVGTPNNYMGCACSGESCEMGVDGLFRKKGKKNEKKESDL